MSSEDKNLDLTLRQPIHSPPMGLDLSIAQPGQNNNLEENILGEEDQGRNDDGSDVHKAKEVDYQPLNPPPELVAEAIVQKPQDSTENTNTLAPPANQRPRAAMIFPISKITIGNWECTAVNPTDLEAKVYFGKKKLIWETMYEVEIGAQVARRKRKIEIKWADILSFKVYTHKTKKTGRLLVELGKRPTFYMEADPKPGKPTQWDQIDDFTPNQEASTHRRHTLYCSEGVLKQKFNELYSSDNFWLNLKKIAFPTLPESLYFDKTEVATMTQ